ncbi:uncharacterized protein F5Z01DRAFT_482366 [Emericellopsis atlantica]|uniref:Uncharacterized protein n=1 Tax=Emericellopsis atlantica TaxID=2614577 RepID=A0A9P8CR58_9HYPO|nr:uncharacterized protein F5Z01DRAFT_482366 [Emericellopsis atlantica]KAG9256679.1 hypothetical protein F5Z01DRAFT_482366 [Emericellopsis atlantica]
MDLVYNDSMSVLYTGPYCSFSINRSSTQSRPSLLFPISPLTLWSINLRPLQKRSFSIMSTLRNVGRFMEAHPFERLPSTKAKAPADWGRQIRRIGGQTAIFFPFYAVMMGWPLAIAWASRRRNGYVIPEESRRLGYECN